MPLSKYHKHTHNTHTHTRTHMHTHTVHTHTHARTCTHTHTHTSSSVHLVHKDVGQDLWCGLVAIQRVMDDSSPCCAVIHHLMYRLARSLWTASIHLRGVPPGGLHFRICRCGQWIGIRIKWPNHWSLLSLSWSLWVASPHSFKTSALQYLAHKVRIFRRH